MHQPVDFLGEALSCGAVRCGGLVEDGFVGLIS